MRPESGFGSGSDKVSFGSGRVGSAPFISEYPKKFGSALKQTEKCGCLLELCSTSDLEAYEKNCLSRPLRVPQVFCPASGTESPLCRFVLQLFCLVSKMPVNFGSGRIGSGFREKIFGSGRIRISYPKFGSGRVSSEAESIFF